MTNGILKDVEYFRLTAAAEQLQCSIHDLLHLGAIGKAEIIAPILLSGPYEWPVSAIGEAYPEMEPAFRSSFGLHDRVALLAEDLKKIEAIGWATPKAFFAPSRGMEIAAHWRGDEVLQKMSYDQIITEDMVILQKIYQSGLSLDETEPVRTQEEFPDFFARMEECAIFIPWYGAGPMPKWGNAQEEDQGSSEAKQDGIKQDAVSLRTTIEHLFISKKEMDRLVTSAPQDRMTLKRKNASSKPKKIHGNATRYSSNREQVLAFAIYCQGKWPQQCEGTATNWAEVIDEKAPLHWEAGKPPLSRVEIEKLLREALSIGDKKK